MNTTQQSGFKLDSRTIIIGVLILIAAVFLLPRLFNSGTPTVDNPPVDDGSSQSVDSNIELGRPVAATGIDADGCPVGSASTFESTSDIYVVAPNSYIPAGTSVFARLYFDGQPIEDAPKITSDRAYENTCINFVFEPTAGTRSDPGTYEAEFIINGNTGETVSFEVR